MCLMWAVRATGANDKVRAIGFDKWGSRNGSQRVRSRCVRTVEPLCAMAVSAMATSAMAAERNLVASVRSGHTCKRDVTYTV